MGTGRGTDLGTSRARPSQSHNYDNSNYNGLGSYRSSPFTAAVLNSTRFVSKGTVA